MLEADAAMTQQAMNSSDQFRFHGDDKVYAEFYLHARKNNAKSIEEGRDIFEEVPYVKIMVPGDKENIVQRPVRNSDKERFPRQWAAFKNREEQPLEGTPLEEWPGISRSQVEELKYFGIRTVEALAELPDSQAGKFMGIQTLKKKAKDWIEDAKYAAPLAEAREENEQLKSRIEILESQIAELMEAQEYAEVQDD